MDKVSLAPQNAKQGPIVCVKILFPFYVDVCVCVRADVLPQVGFPGSGITRDVGECALLREHSSGETCKGARSAGGVEERGAQSCLSSPPQDYQLCIAPALPIMGVPSMPAGLQT